MANDGVCFVPQCGRNARDISGERANVVVGDGRWTIAAAVAALIGHGHLKLGLD
jgi:hypothetical protein